MQILTTGCCRASERNTSVHLILKTKSIQNAYSIVAAAVNSRAAASFIALKRACS